MNNADVGRLLVDGEWVDGVGVLEIRDPGTGLPTARVAQGDAVLTARALEASERAFAGWRDVPALRRGDVLLALARELEARRDEMARTITLQNGKPLAQSYAEVAGSVDHLRWFAEEGRRTYGRVIPHQAEGKRHLVIHVPIGVAAAISPWNFPLLLAVRKVAPAMAAWCTVVLRAASQTAGVGVLLAECAVAAGVPRGVFQMISGPARAMAGEFLRNPICRKLSFTGSTPVGKELMRAAAENVTKLSLELGGHAPVVVFDDADVDVAVEALVVAKYRNTGQSCIAANRVLVQAGIYERFVEAFAARVRELKVGYGLDEGVDVGPMMDEAALNGALAQIENAVAAGARILAGGRRAYPVSAGSAPDLIGGFYLEPTVLEGVAEGCACMREESFAPLIPIARFRTEEDAVTMANSTPFGLAAYVFTTSVGKMWRMAERIEAGMIGINDGVPTTSNAPFGGVKQSGMGRELGTEGIMEYMETKHISFGAVDRLA